jgi:Squalene-hopene cyclase C-terminal domain
MKRSILALAGALALALTPQLSAAAFVPQTLSATRALDWIEATQLGADGAVGGDATRTEETVFGLVANHRPIATFVKAGSTANPLDYLAANLASEEGSAGNIAQLILAVTAAGQPAGSFGPPGAKHDLLSDLNGEYVADTGEYGTTKVFDHIMAVLALRSLDQTPSTGAITFLKSQQKSDGGWSFDNADAFGTDTNTTALALVALSASGALDACTASKAIAYLHAAQQPDGGFPSQVSYPTSDPDSDGIVIEGLLAAGQDPTGSAWTKPGNQNPLTNLLSFQGLDGSFSFPGVGPDNLLATTQPLVALASQHLPLTPEGTSFAAPIVGTCQPTAASPSATPRATTTAAATPQAALLAQTGSPAHRSSLPPDAGLLILGAVALLSGWRLRRRFD